MGDRASASAGAGVLALQRALAELAFGSDPGLMRQDPMAFARAQGLGARNQAAWARNRDRLLAYRDFIRSNLTEPIEEALPITLALLDGVGAWEACLDAFLAARVVRSPFHRDIAASFLGWLAETAWGRERWPFLLELAHFELLQALVYHYPASPVPAGLHATPCLEDKAVLDPAVQLVSYAFAVHRATPEAPEPEPGPVHLLVARSADGSIGWQELTPATSALLVGVRTQAIGASSQALGLPDPTEALGLLAAFCTQRVILGFTVQV